MSDPVIWHLIDRAGNYLRSVEHTKGHAVPVPVAPEPPPPAEPGKHLVWTNAHGWEQRDEPASPPPVPEPVPEAVSRFQARAALLQAGLLSAVEDAVAAADPMVQLAWAEAVEWRRQSPNIIALGAAIGLNEAQLDDLFRAAAQIEM